MIGSLLDDKAAANFIGPILAPVGAGVRASEVGSLARIGVGVGVSVGGDVAVGLGVLVAVAVGGNGVEVGAEVAAGG